MIAQNSTDGLRQALSLVARKDWEGAKAAAPAGLGQAFVEWHRLRAGEGYLGDYEAFLASYSDWPGLALLRRKGETAVARSTTPERVQSYFLSYKPATPEGSMALIKAHQAAGWTAEAQKEARRAWLELEFDAAQEADFLSLAGPALSDVHQERLERLLWENRRAEAQRMLDRVSPAQANLARARLALRADQNGVNALIEAVPSALAQDAGLAYERFTWRLRQKLNDGALELLLARSGSLESLGDPSAWSKPRILLVRRLLEENRPRDAYRAAVNHHLLAGGDYADLEFLAGWIALRKLNQPEAALRHFQALRDGVGSPISLSRGWYWEGRAREASGQQPEALAAYREAARHQTSYYGLLAAEHLGESLDPALLSASNTPDWRQASFANSSVLATALMLHRLGERDQAKRFILHLAESQDETGLAQLGNLALELDDAHLAVLLGKQAAARNIILPQAYFPLTDMVPDGQPVSRALALSIARRESEFNPVVKSGAGALGLMQVMPGTAKLMTDKLGLPYNLGRLTSDPSYNVKLGSSYLAQLIEEFGPSVALIASGYNAGPGRPRRWINEFGDPRHPNVDVIDWVETIPFAETRTYVMRVVESVVIYRAKLRGAPGPIKVRSELTGR